MHGSTWVGAVAYTHTPVPIHTHPNYTSPDHQTRQIHNPQASQEETNNDLNLNDKDDLNAFLSSVVLS